MKRTQGRELRRLPSVNYREVSSTDDLLEVTSEEEALSSGDPDEVQTETASTPFRLAPPRLLIEGVTLDTSEDASEETVSTVDPPVESLAEDYHSAVTYLERLPQESDVQTLNSVASGSPTVVEGGTSRDSVDASGSDTSNAPLLGVENAGLNTENPLVDRVAEMADVELRKTATQLQSVMFQIGELHESMEDIDVLTEAQVVEMHDELKTLRVQMHTLNTEINLINDPRTNYHADVVVLLATSKEDLRLLKLKVASIESAKEERQADRDSEADAERIRVQKQRDAEQVARLNAFKRAVQEIEVMRKSLLRLYSVENLSGERSEVLRREKEKTSIAAEFTRMRDLVNTLLTQPDVIPGKEDVLNDLTDYVKQIEECKVVYEDKVHRDLVENDLTEEKLKLAELTKIDVGKFNGELGVGDDFYTFKSKFNKAYINHPKTLKVEWLKNNHLEGPAKAAVGSLECLDEIWVRLKNNFGNTELMLNFKFGIIDKLGPMGRRRGFKAKKVYVQTLINVMQDVLDLAVEHSLTYELHYGQQLSKIVSLLESHYQNQWYKILADEQTVKVARWDRMLTFLNGQLTILQLRAFEECESSGSREREDKEREEKEKRKSVGVGGGGKVTRVNVSKKLCNFCDQMHPNPNSEFTNCKKFLLMSCKDRAALVRKLKYCLQCLSGKTKFNDPNHVCSERWICRNVAHASYQKKLHFLVCETHSGDDDNVALFGSFQIDRY